MTKVKEAGQHGAEVIASTTKNLTKKIKKSNAHISTVWVRA